MNVFKKLQQARVKLHNTQLHKSGKNSFAKFNYFELGDFVPQVTAIFNDLGLCETISFTQETAYLTIYNVDGEKDDFVTFTSPMVYANMEKLQAIQNLGSTHTYMRRYLWLMAMEIVENDAVDASAPVEKKDPLEPPFKPIKATTVQTPVGEVTAKVHAKLEGKPGDWQISVKDPSNLPALVGGVEVLLALVKTEEDMKMIFQKNRALFDTMKADYPAEYEQVLDKFKQTKESLKKE
jgi:hypothetical protein